MVSSAAPCLLPREQQQKDRLFIAIVRALS